MQVKNNLIKVVLGAVILMVVAFSAYYLGNNSNTDIIDNDDVKIEYISNGNGTYEVYVDIKDGQVSEIPGNDTLDSFLIAPDME